MKKVASLILPAALAVTLWIFPAFVLAGETESEESNKTLALGEAFPDFTAVTTEGTFTLSEELKDHEAVLLIFWASWCPPCYDEFPYIQKMSEELEDQVRVIALSIEKEDSMELIEDYGQELGLTFPLGRDEDNLYAYTPLEGYPTPVLIDRFGKVCYMTAGSLPSEEAAFNLVNAVLGDDYETTRTFKDLPGAQTDLAYASEEDLTLALTGGEGDLRFQNDLYGYDWPWLPETVDGRRAAKATNTDHPTSQALAETSIRALEGDVLTFDFKLSAEPMDFLEVELDGSIVKSYAGVRDWTSAVIPLEAGEHEIRLIFRRNMDLELHAVEEESAWISNARLLSGEEAAALISALPSCPVSEETGIRVLNGEAGRLEILYEEPESGESMDILDAYGLPFMILNGSSSPIEISLDGSIDPDAEVLLCVDEEGSRAYAALSELLNAEGTAFETDLLIQDGEAMIHAILIGPDFLTDSMYYEYGFSPSLEEAQEFLQREFLDPMGFGADDVRFVVEGGKPEKETEFLSMETETEEETELSSMETEADYRISVIDQDGNPVSGAIVNICTDTTCTTGKSDEKGLILFTGEKQSYHLQLLKAPDGYSFDSPADLYTEDQTDFTISVSKD